MALGGPELSIIMTGVLPTKPHLLPDLLHHAPLQRIDFEQTKLALNLAFAGGVSGGLFSEALEKAIVAPSSWSPNSFAGDLFLTRFVTQCFKVQIGAVSPVIVTSHLLRVLAQPPLDHHSIAFRRAILAELAQFPELGSRLEGVYMDLSRLRGLLESAGAMRVWDANRRKLDILQSLRQIVDAMADSFATASSGLRRLAEFGAQVRESEPFHALVELLRYDAQLATMNLRVTIGADGRIRDFDISALRENSENVFVSSPWRRWLAKVELFARGYRFGEAEVMGRLIDGVFSGLEAGFVVLVQCLGDLEFYLGAMSFRDRAAQAGLATCLPDIVADDAPRSLHGLFNPLLLASGVIPTPCDLELPAGTATMLITGPNSGGKTRLLQSLGLSQLLAQSGVFVPARAARMRLASGLVASLIEEAKADQVEGRLGMELLRIRALFETLPPGAMVLLDELCSGTNPSEGEQIFELVVSMLNRLRPQAFITTHFLAFAARLQRARKIQGLGFMQVELDPQRRPTYQFVPGVAETSLAEHTAERLGVTGDQLLQLIEANVRKQQALSNLRS